MKREAELAIRETYIQRSLDSARDDRTQKIPGFLIHFKYLSNHATVCSSRSTWCLGSMNIWPSPG